MGYTGKKPTNVVDVSETQSLTSDVLNVTTSATIGSDLTVDTTTLHVDSTNNRVGIGTTSPAATMHLKTGTNENFRISSDSGVRMQAMNDDASAINTMKIGGDPLTFLGTGGTERMRVDSSGRLLVGKTAADGGVAGFEARNTGETFATASGTAPLYVHRLSDDGVLVNLQQGGSTEGNISVSGTTVSYNGGHLSRWSQLSDGTKDTSIVKGTVMTNLDKMAVWAHDAVDGKDAYTEDNEQLNCMAVSSVEGDPNVAGVFVNWDNDDDSFNDMNVAMTGDMVIRIAKNTTVARGDLLMSAGDGTAKAQDDDIVRSKTIAKVTSTQVSHTYDDGTYLVPCVLMAC